jgi:DNA-binding LytR/AlgR family response regulator
MAKNFTYAIIDDDALTHQILTGLCKDITDLTCQGTFTDPTEAIAKINQDKYDILFIDIEMPEMTGLELISQLNYDPEVILISAEEKYAIQSYDYDIVDYVLKPFTPERVKRAVAKAIERINEVINTIPDFEFIFLKVDTQYIKYKVSDIAYFEAYGDYVKVHDLTGKFNLLYTSMRIIEKKLPESKFSRIHRSFIVAIENISSIDSSSVYINKNALPISNTYKKGLMNKIPSL